MASPSPLKQGFLWVLVEKITVNEITVIFSTPRERPVTEQDIGSGAAWIAGRVCLAKDIVPDSRDLVSHRHAGKVGPWPLVLDLQVIAQGLGNKIVFNQSCDKGCAAI